MKNIYINIAMTLWRHALLMAVAVAAISCGDENAVTSGELKPSGDGISVSIALAGQKPSQTRGVGEDSEDTSGEFGTDAENYINMDDLYVMTFSIPEGSSVLTDDSELLEILWAPTGANHKTESSVSSNGETVYLVTQLDASIPQYASGKDFCIVALANNMSGFQGYTVKNPTKGMRFSELCEYSFTFDRAGRTEWNWSPDNAASKGIPLFGVKKVNLSGYNPKYHSEWNPYKLGGSGNPTVWLLRAFAKMTVSLSDELRDMEINGVKDNVSIVAGNIGNSYAYRYWIIPEVNRMQGFASTGGTGQIVVAPNLTASPPGTPVGNKVLLFNVAPDGKSACIYIPENVVNDATRPKIKLTLNVGGNNQDFEFDFKRYPKNDGTGDSDQSVWWNYILRNHFYKFVISLDFRVISVFPSGWNETIDNEFNFG